MMQPAEETRRTLHCRGRERWPNGGDIGGFGLHKRSAGLLLLLGLGAMAMTLDDPTALIVAVGLLAIASAIVSHLWRRDVRQRLLGAWAAHGSGRAALAFNGLAPRVLLAGTDRVRLSTLLPAPEKAILVAHAEGESTAALRRLLREKGYQVDQQLILPAMVDLDGGGLGDFDGLLQGFFRGYQGERVFLLADDNMALLLWRMHALPMPLRVVTLSIDLASFSDVRAAREPLASRGVRRAFDIAFAGAAVIGLLPLLTLVAIAIKTSSPGPVIFRQMRGGLDGKPFRIFKFRTMTVQENGDRVEQARREDRRVTQVGRWLRRSSIDELPQLFNVLRGEMSIVGPRPHALAHDKLFAAKLAQYPRRFMAKPGLTGWAQVHGLRGETATTEEMARRVDYDIWYVQNRSLLLDLTIVVRTVVELARSRNAY